MKCESTPERWIVRYDEKSGSREVANVPDIGPILTALFIVATSYAATNLDNLILLVGWLLGAQCSVGRIFAGYMLGMSMILVVSGLIGLVGYVVPAEYLGYLGAIPIALGLKMLVDLWRRRERKTGGTSSPAMQNVAVGGIVLTTLSNGVDSVLVFAPLLADSLLNVDLTIAIAFMIMVCLWFELAKYATTHAKRVKVLSTAGEWVAPIVMILVGLYILDNTATDMFPGS